MPSNWKERAINFRNKYWNGGYMPERFDDRMALELELAHKEGVNKGLEKAAKEAQTCGVHECKVNNFGQWFSGVDAARNCIVEAIRGLKQ
jgi:hypothetical protein